MLEDFRSGKRCPPSSKDRHLKEARYQDQGYSLDVSLSLSTNFRQISTPLAFRSDCSAILGQTSEIVFSRILSTSSSENSMTSPPASFRISSASSTASACILLVSK